MTDAKLEHMAGELEKNADYRVLRRYQRVSQYHPPDPDLIASDKLRRGIFLDVETTGLDAATDQVIELALVPFEFASDGRIFRVLDEYNGLRDPGIPIPEEITRLTGISNEAVAGKQLDATQIKQLMQPAHLVIAHNAGFDRPFVEQIHPLFAERAWACSLNQIAWRDEGIQGMKLDYLAACFGFFYDAHRATIDCLAGIHVLAQSLPISGRPALSALLDNARLKTMRIWAEGSPFDSKDRLKARAYHWNGGDDGRPKAWYRDVPEAELDDELSFLKKEIFGGRLPELRTDTINAFNRYSTRA